MLNETLNLKRGILIFSLLFFGLFSCKKEDSISDKKYSNGKSFQNELQEKLIAYDKNHPILDSISAIGKIDWSKLMARYSISNRNPINFDLPIVTDGSANSLIEFAFTFDFKLIDIKIRRLSSIEDTKNVNNFEATRTGRMLYQFSKQGLKINKSLLKYRQEAERLHEKVDRSLLNMKVSSSTVMNNNIPPGPPPSAPINLPGLGNYHGPVYCYSEFDFDFLFIYNQDHIALGQNYHEYLSERFYYNLYYRSGGIFFNIPYAYSNKIHFYNTELDPGQLGDLVWRVLDYCLYDVNQYMAPTEFLYFYYSVSGTCGGQLSGQVTYGNGPRAPSPEPNPPKEIRDSVQNPCIKAQLNLALTAKTTILSMLNTTFGGSVPFEDLSLTFTDVTTLPDTISGDAGRASATSIYFDIRLNKNTLPTFSKEYILSTIYHEILHAYLYSKLTKGADGKYNISTQHEDMATQYVILMIGALKIAYPSISDQEAWALSWGGLEETNLYDQKLSQDQKSIIAEINRKHTNKSTPRSGTYCN